MQISRKFRESDAGYHHWCSGCNRLHTLPKGRGWTYFSPGDGMSAIPSFHLSWQNERVCHYFLTNGQIDYLADCHHALRGPQPVPDLPEDYRDFEREVPA